MSAGSGATSAITIEAPIPGLDEYRKKHGIVINEKVVKIWQSSDERDNGGGSGDYGQGRFCRAAFMKGYGTKVVAGVTPGSGGEEVSGIPVFNTVTEAVKAKGPIDATVTFVPGPGLKDAVFEAIDSDIKLIVSPVERVPLYDILEMVAYAKQKGARLLGPGSIGIISPGHRGGGLAWRHRSSSRGRSSYRAMSGSCPAAAASRERFPWASNQAGLGMSTVLHVGTEPVTGMSFGEILPLFEKDPDTDGRGDLRRDRRFPRGRGGRLRGRGKVHQADHHLRLRRLGAGGDEVLPCEQHRRTRQRLDEEQDRIAQGSGVHVVDRPNETRQLRPSKQETDPITHMKGETIMAVMRSVFYVPGNNERFIQKAPSLPADIITLDLEDSVPPAEKAKAREMVRENLKLAGTGGSKVYFPDQQLGDPDDERRPRSDRPCGSLRRLSGQDRPSRRREAARLEARRAGEAARPDGRQHRHPAPDRDGQGNDQRLSLRHRQQARELADLRRRRLLRRTCG